MARNARVMADAEEKRLKVKYGNQPIPPGEPRDEDGRHLGIRFRTPEETKQPDN